MASLHLIFGATGDSQALEPCLARAGDGDAILLMGGAVAAAVSGANPEAAGGRLACYVLIPDLEAGGLDLADLAPNVRPIDYAGFVALTKAYHPIVSWP